MLDASTLGQTPVLDLELGGLSYGRTPILGSISLQVARGETCALVGPSGIGKSSLLRIFAGLEKRFSGHCHVTGPTAIVFQEPALLPWRTLRQNLMITAKVSTEAADQALADVGLADRATDFPEQLSLGQQRRMALARAFAVRPALLLLDEPFVSLDPELVEEMMALFDRLRAAHNVATVLVTHVREEADKLADRVVTLGGCPAQITRDTQNNGAYFQLSASGVTSSRS